MLNKLVLFNIQKLDKSFRWVFLKLTIKCQSTHETSVIDANLSQSLMDGIPINQHVFFCSPSYEQPQNVLKPKLKTNDANKYSI